MKHRGNRLNKGRDQRPKRSPKLGGYLIITDGEKTERNYFEDIKKNIPKKYENNLQIKIHLEKELKKIIQFAEQKRYEDPRFRNIWLIFDRDEVPNFDEIIKEAERVDMEVGWSNPCFEIWLSAYFGEMKPSTDSRGCISRFEKLLIKNTDKREYKKSDKGIYKILLESGNEAKAIKIAEKRHKEQEKRHQNPSEMKACTTVFRLVSEIRTKTNRPVSESEIIDCP